MASPSSIELGDEVLVQQDKTNKLSTAFNYPLDSAIGFPNTYPLDSDLSGG